MAKKSKFDNRQSILSTKSESVLGYRLTTEQQIWIGYILPAIVNCAVYIADVSTSLTLAERHFEEKNFVAASVTLTLIFTPSIVFCGYSIYKRNYWNIHDSTKEKTLFVLLRLLNIIAFPAWIIYRYAKQIFWSIEALFQQGHKREEALHFARKPSWVYFHLFLQAFLQSAPQAYFQLCILLKQYENNYQTDIMHVACILSSLTMLAITVASFQRFESQKVIGRQLPWSLKYWTTSDLGKRKDNRLSCLVEYDKRMDKTHEICDTQKPGDEMPETVRTVSDQTDAMKNHPDAPHLETRQVGEKISELDTGSISDSNSTPYLEPKNIHNISRSDLDLTEETSEHKNINASVRILDEETSASQVSHKISSTDENNTEVSDSQMKYYEPGVTGSADPSEPDGGVVTLRKGGSGLNESGCASGFYTKDNTNLTIPLFEAPPIPVTNNPTDELENNLGAIKRIPSITRDEIHKIKGIDLDEPVGKIIAFLWWLFFLISRMTAMAIAFQMSHIFTLGISLGQYAVTVGILTYLDHSSTKRILINFFLSYVYLYALVEYKMRFRRPFLSNVLFFLILSIEDVAICTVWYFLMEFVDWWETYVFMLMCGNLVLSLFSFLTYFAILKPKPIIIRPTAYL